MKSATSITNMKCAMVGAKRKNMCTVDIGASAQLQWQCC